MSLIVGWTLLGLGMALLLGGAACSYASATAARSGALDRFFRRIHDGTTTRPVTLKDIQDTFASIMFVGLLFLAGSLFFLFGRFIAPNDLALFTCAVGVWATSTCFLVWFSAPYAPYEFGEAKSPTRKLFLAAASGAGLIGFGAFYLVGGPWLVGGAALLYVVLLGILRNYARSAKLASS